MKTTFGRTFSTAAAILLLALLVLGASFQSQVREYLTDTTMADMQKDAKVISELAAAYSIDGSLSSRDFLLNLDIASQVSDSDAVICDVRGRVILCSDALSGCEHQGLQVNEEYLATVIKNGGHTDTGIIGGLYKENRYVVSVPIRSNNGKTVSGIVIVSTPTATTDTILNRISRIFLSVALIVVLFAVLAVSAFARNHSKPLRDMAKVANAFGHGDFEGRAKRCRSFLWLSTTWHPHCKRVNISGRSSWPTSPTS